ncbi:hypothetical protein HYDPIDRAFT_120103 [Hydnomerulius pinastri MD-312]|uniref:Uncharacterized protein n=1 Tax=Hydnomerulius pinastri MD-312 TaxID=994086 RepID=A0A0C9VXH3_9AGAM|nr:hypothetical protein HYDPIDRAFT_120103 [Hydnomerulius pinastri MD-312]
MDLGPPLRSLLPASLQKDGTETSLRLLAHKLDYLFGQFLRKLPHESLIWFDDAKFHGHYMLRQGAGIALCAKECALTHLCGDRGRLK